VDPVRLEVFSDYLCPWCYVASHRLRRLESEHGDALRLEWRSFLLRPHPAPRPREAFVRYTQSWQRPAAEPDAPVLRPWQGEAGPPSHSLPPHVLAKAAARLGRAAFDAVHDRLLAAYFAESRDIGDPSTLRAVWAEAGLAPVAFEASAEPALEEEVRAEHRAALERGITGVPAVSVAGRDAWVLGAQPLDVLRRWIGRLRGGVLD
jgi:predicted DsbA family dithiol-disulfide isomerase